MEEFQEHESDKQKVKTLLESGERISVKSVWMAARTSETRHYIAQLRKDGMTILSEWVKRKGKRFKEYWYVKPEDPILLK